MHLYTLLGLSSGVAVVQSCPFSYSHYSIRDMAPGKSTDVEPYATRLTVGHGVRLS